MEDTKLSMELTIQQWNVVMNALAHRPFNEVFEVITSLKTQGDNLSSAKKSSDNFGVQKD